MKRRVMTGVSMLVVFLLYGNDALLHAQTPMGTAFTYQGRLVRTGIPVNDTCDFEFDLWDALSFGTQIGTTQTFWSVPVGDGLFVVWLDFGTGVFDGDARWLEIGVHCTGDPPGYSTLSPRHELTPTPYAIYAETAGTASGAIGGSGTTNYIAKFTSTSTIGDSVIYENSGRIGIGTTTPAADLHISNSTFEDPDTTIRLHDFGMEGAQLAVDLTAEAADMLGYFHGLKVTGNMWSTGMLFATDQVYAGMDGTGVITTGNALVVNGSAGIGTIYTNFTAPTDGLIVEGDVGIGTTTPGAELEVNGQVKITGGSPGAGKVLTSDANGLGTWVTPAAGGIGGGGTTNYITKFTSPTTVGDSVIYENSGQIGIGTTTPGATLDVSGVAGESIRATNTSLSERWIEMLYHGSVGPLLWSGDGYPRLTLDANSGGGPGQIQLGLGGDAVGIGTASPTHRLHVAGDNSTVRLEGTGVLGSDAKINFGDADYVYITEDEDDKLYVRAAQRTAIMGGPVGIGTTTPSYKLDVAGTIRATGTIYGTVDNADKVDGLHVSDLDGRYVNEGQANSVSSGMLQSSSVTTAKIANDAVTVDKLAHNINATGIGFNADMVDGYHVSGLDGRYVNEGQSDSINATMLQANSVGSSEIAAGAVGTSEIATNGVAAAEIAAGAVGTSEIATNGVAAAEIAADAVGSSEIAANAVGSSEIATNAVTLSELADPLNLGGTTWDWDMTTGRFDIDKTSGFPALDITNSSTTSDTDCLYLRSSTNPGNSSTYALYVSTYRGKAGVFVKSTDDGEYALYVASPSSTANGLYVFGDTVATGTKSAAIETSQGREAIFSVESPEVEIYASGSASLTSGEAYVAFDRLFTEAVSPDVKIRVTVTPTGEWSALYVKSADPDGFSVHSAGGDANIEFDWMACGRRNGYELRPEATIPDPVEDERLREAKLARAEEMLSD